MSNSTRTRRPGKTRRFAAVVAAGVGFGAGALFGAADVAACDGLSVPTVGVERCVIPGLQAEIDAGNVVRYDTLSTDQVHWLAGHRTSHGATFRPLTGLEIGDPVEYRGTRYEIVEYRLADRLDPGDVLDWVDSSAPMLVLQTSAHDTFLHIWRALPVDDAVVAEPAADAATATIVASRPPVPVDLGDATAPSHASSLVGVGSVVGGIAWPAADV